jgi:nicotinate-nucleotide adenylyltransferase
VMRLGIMGGTFDPIHDAHLRAASEVAQKLSLDEVLLVPAGQPYHRGQHTVSPAEDRYAMAAIATATNPLLSVSRVELERSGPSYTVDMLCELRATRGPGVDLFLIVGADALAQIHSWKDAGRLFALAHVIGCSRVGYPLADPGMPGVRAGLVQVARLAMSATLIRQRVGSGVPIRELVPEGVARYIDERRLYREARPCPGVPTVRLAAAGSLGGGQHGGRESAEAGVGVEDWDDVSTPPGDEASGLR